MGNYSRGMQRHWLAGPAAIICMAVASPVIAQTRTFNVPAQDASRAIPQFAKQAGVQVLAPAREVRGKRTRAVKGSYSVQDGLRMLLEGSGLEIAPSNGTGIVMIRAARQTSRPVADTTSSLGEDEGSAGEEIVVTGTNIRGGAPTGSRLQQISRADIERSGYGTVQDYFRTVPQNFADVSDRAAEGLAGGSPSAVYGSGINLRGLGSESTLILLNGHRLTPAGNGAFVDISLIPASAIEGVDVLADGASAIYGSDAVGGVVNFRLRQDFEGFETRARYGVATRDGADEFSIGQAAGLAWGGGNALVSGELYRRAPIFARDRNFTKDAGDPTYLLPRQRRSSVFAVANQEVTNSFSLSADGFYSRRSFASSNFVPGVGSVTTGNAEQYGTSANALLAFGSGWNLTVGSAFSHNQSHVVADYGASGRSTADLRSSVLSADAKVDGSLFEIAGGPIRFAAGGHVRSQRYSQVGAARYQRTVYAGFGEVQVPLFSNLNAVSGFQRLTASAAVRTEHYSDFGTATSPKFGLSWVPVEGLAFRGNWGKSFRAPKFDDTSEANSNAFVYPLPDPVLGGNTTSLVVAGGNPDLKPERATTWSVGADLVPAGFSGFEAHFTYYAIDYRDRIANPVPQGFGFLGAIDVLAPFAFRNPSPELVQSIAALPYYHDFGFPLSDVRAFADLRLRNVARTRQSGLDLDARYTAELSGVEVQIGAAAQYIFKNDYRVITALPAQSRLNLVGSPADFKLKAMIGLSTDSLGLNAVLNHVAPYKDDRFGPSMRVKPWNSIDLSLSYRITGKSPTGPSAQLQLAATNLLDSDPPYVADPINAVHYDGTNADPLGRQISVQLIAKY